ncbi:MAG: inorganic phosphate transporter [Planctomycetota bacterium]|nr:inorganic phosphate transporter [Planctomycetota bacterium]
MELPALLLCAGAAWLSYANGANDNVKGVATLLGSGTITFRQALTYGTLTTLAGSIAAVLISGGLVAAFSGKGIVPSVFVGDTNFLVPVGIAAAIVVMTATFFGLPISTTHALVGGLAGAGVAAAGFDAVGWTSLSRTFLLPLLLSPLCAVALVAVLYPLASRARAKLGVEHDSRVCFGEVTAPVVAFADSGNAMSSPSNTWATVVASNAECRVEYTGRVFGFQASKLLDRLHFASAGIVGFSRGLNDTPKIAALLLVGAALSPVTAMIAVAVGMSIGAILNGRRIAKTMSFDITSMNAGQGFTANITTAALVLGASRLGVPVSTTHVSVGAIFGIGISTGAARSGTIKKILLAWLVTLPAAFALAWTIHRIRS